VIDALDELLGPHLFPPRADGTDARLCPVCGSGRLSLKLSQYGAFIGCSNFPDCRNTRPLSVPGADGAEEIGTKVLGIDPDSGLEVTLRTGRFGPYVQLGEVVNAEKPKRAGLLRGMQAGGIDLDTALKLLSLPREVGRHPEDGEPIRAAIGRYGPYVQHGKTYANLEDGDDVFNIGLNRAVTLIAEKIAKGPGRRRFGADPGRPLGDHPTKGGPIVAKNGRYGPYVSHAGVNATLPRDKTPETVTLAEAVALLDARADRNGPAPRARPRNAKRTGKRPATSAEARTTPRPAAKPVKRAANSKAKRKPPTEAAE
jgi:DNA topoisomerase I